MPLARRPPRRWTIFCSSPATTGEFDLLPRRTLLSWWTSTWTSGRWVPWTKWARSTPWTVTSGRAGRINGWATTRMVWTSLLSTGLSWLKSGCRTRFLSMENNLSSTKSLFQTGRDCHLKLYIETKDANPQILFSICMPVSVTIRPDLKKTIWTAINYMRSN